MIKFF